MHQEILQIKKKILFTHFFTDTLKQDKQPQVNQLQ